MLVVSRLYMLLHVKYPKSTPSVEIGLYDLFGRKLVQKSTNTSSDAAHQVAERIRLKLSSFDKTSSGGQLPEPITISMGVFTATSSSVTAEACVESADKAMYEAKETGRNRVVVFK